ncbi:hypothetical protein HMPREF9514_02528 [Enterococcus faecalis TX0855]|uniref:hypothetical protein n=1 Tax=Enterococcus faecalis TaxID=1351 RepID=UPI0001CB2CAE|nr:hypothetical protein [Enterococcus faecalis]EFE19718.1 hypothetical protein HMPREF9376_01254 [Enterococcus faecalis S613]EFM78618.1 hypothetical protein HMPREF9514_02528 [Enterococcus faecalis TX0855]EFQ09412.1 hypothetical protein HMPREF9492_02179 [Enterococcus faecalis DAPTO 512]EFQ66215.1 hypothetical protein HMPREF9493_03143 [Enterococcus faecalis DAPTO 516]EJV01365.1 hypothetical protein HMPREF1330_00145 [Enterococcus faecalis ERV129]
MFKNQNRKKENQMNKEQAFQTLDSLVYAMEKLENESIRSEDNEELEQMLALMNRDWHELYTIYGKAWEEYRKNALEK